MVRLKLIIDIGVRRALLAAIIFAPAWWIDVWNRYPGTFSNPATRITIALLFAQAALVMLALVALIARPDRWSLIAALGLVSGYCYGSRGHTYLGADALASMAPFGFFVGCFIPLAWSRSVSQPAANRGQFTVRTLLGVVLASACFLAAVRGQQQVELKAVPLWLPLILLAVALWGRSSTFWRALALLSALLIAPLAGSVAHASIFLRGGVGLEYAVESARVFREHFPYVVIARRWLLGPDFLFDQAWSYGYSAALSTLFALLGMAVLKLNGLVRLDSGSRATTTPPTD